MNGLSEDLISTASDHRGANPTTSQPAVSADAAGEYPIGPKTLRRLYTLMVTCRIVEEQRGEKRSGSEAILVGATIGLRHDDHIAASERSFIADVVRGLPLRVLIAPTAKKRKRPNQIIARPATSTTATEFSIATGVALGFQMQKKHNVVVAFSLRKAGSPDFWRAPARFAATHKLPIVFVVANPDRQGRVTDFSRQAQKYGLPGIPVDMNDAVAVYRVAHEAIDRARRGAGPTLIECKTWAHAGADDPIGHMRQYLQWKGLWSEDWSRQITESIRGEIDSAIRSKR